MQEQEITEKLKGLIETYVEDKSAFANISPETHLINDLKINSAHLVDIILDAEEAFDWTNIAKAYDADGQITQQTSTYDDGRTAETVFEDGVRSSIMIADVDNAYSWASINHAYDPDGMLVQSTTVYDDGSEVTVFYEEDFLL